MIERDFDVRPARLDDIDAIVELTNAAALADTGMLGTTRSDKLIELQLPNFDIETDSRLVLAPSGQAAGYVELWDSKPHVRLYTWGRVHPDYRGRGLGRYLLDWAEGRARKSLHKAPPGARVSLHTSAVRDNAAAHELFEERGFVLARHFFRLCIEMSADAPPSPPVLPEGIALRPFVLGQDDRAAHRILQEAFKDHWGVVESESFEEWMHWIENDETFAPSVCVLAVTNGPGDEEVVGVAMCRPEFEEDPSTAWIDELGVLRAWRRRGIATAMLRQVLGEFHQRGRYKVGLGVDANSLTGALDLYEKAGMRVFRQTDAYEKILRPGKDLSTQSL
ncbi:MAG: GNAT family N-acetyltransferase [Anaerolineae bacterium]|jgi:ribosomal protein S18 acetylase RimI-like enzyme